MMMMTMLVMVLLLLLLLHQQNVCTKSCRCVCKCVLQGYCEESVKASNMIYGSSQIGGTLCLSLSLSVCVFFVTSHVLLPEMADGKFDYPSTVHSTTEEEKHCERSL